MEGAQAMLARASASVGAALDQAMRDLPPGDLSDAMRYAASGGKRLRAALVLESARLHGVEQTAALPVA
ncbi:MAG: polyprenyl synthetase family protein, partial [Paracoccus sp. (in: a-proteobacteria)]|nr:polyprenyl synthetase family protein [Paracoccus sp. (in: a-proteobacteria)]